MFRARYVEGRHSATRIHPELRPWKVGDTVPMGAGAYATVWEVKPHEYLVAQETFVLRPLPGGRTRLITRYRGIGFLSPATHAISADAGPVPRLIRFAVLRVPGVDLAFRALDFLVADPLHHFLETGMLTGIKARAEQPRSHVRQPRVVTVHSRAPNRSAGSCGTDRPVSQPATDRGDPRGKPSGTC